jgi:hypothetical protein
VASDPVILEGRFPVSISVSVAVKAGQLLAWDGDSWELADADSPSTKSAKLIAGGNADGSGAVTITAYKEALLYDADAPYTVGAKQYLSGTAGAHTETRPATDGQLRQVVGEALTTDTAHLMIAPVREVPAPIVVTGATSAFASLDSGDFGGPTLDAQNEVAHLVCAVPENAIGVAAARLYLAAEASAGTPTFDLTVSSALDGEQWDAVTADSTLANQALEGGAADELQVLSITTALDATNIIRPGALLGLKALKDDAGTDISFIFGGVVVFNCV